jgi:alkylhydroperoxidase family enzyme
MTRIRKLARTEVGESAREVFERVAAARGNIPNMFRVYAHRPELLETMVAHMNAVTNAGTVPVRTKELVATLVSRINACEY